MLSSGGMNFSLYVGLSMGTGGGVAGVSFTGRPGTSILMLNLRLERSTSSAGACGGAAGEQRRRYLRKTSPVRSLRGERAPGTPPPPSLQSIGEK